MNYQDIGFDHFFRRGNSNKIKSQELPELSASAVESLIDQISGTKLSGGIISSKDGKLTIDLENSLIKYNDGVIDLLKVGGANKELTLKNNSDTILVSNT